MSDQGGHPSGEEEMRFLKTTAGASDDPDLVPKCSVCGESVSGGKIVRCFGCDGPHHKECWDFAGGCGTYGCSGNRGPVPERVEEGGGATAARVGGSALAIGGSLVWTLAKWLFVACAVGAVYVGLGMFLSGLIAKFWLGVVICVFVLYNVY